MHDRAVRPIGAVSSTAVIASETMILLNIDLRIAQVRPRVEESVQAFLLLVILLPLRFWCVVACAILTASGGTPYILLRQLTLQPPVFVCISANILRGRRQ